MMLAPTMGKESGVQNCHVNHRATRHVPPAHVSAAEMPPPPLNTCSSSRRLPSTYAVCVLSLAYKFCTRIVRKTRWKDNPLWRDDSGR